ncbi:hypothetical protein [Arcticibacter sp. MXS-1]|uniref:hypothetical protein n=1 Tax=Arcticibacter sp. MXS-1 TaxID=3341726 RepID=UPI0035A90CF4
MAYTNRDLDRLARNISELIEEEILRAGIFYRIFFRCKSDKSLTRKLKTTIGNSEDLKYDGKTKFLRDVIGIRVNLYFLDDLEILLNFLKTKYAGSLLEETVDVNTTTQFRPTRVNLIFKIPTSLLKEFRDIVKDERIDATYELQLRTVFSEGWHEVEHDFRYKCQDDWKDHSNISRNFNGILAALETHEWSMIKMFEELSYSHYKSKNYGAMVRARLRIGTEDYNLSPSLLDLIESEEGFTKELYKLERHILINFLLNTAIVIPFTVDNILYLINFFL